MFGARDNGKAMDTVKTARLRALPAALEFAAEDATPRRSGRATFDSRGNAVWEWQTDTGDYSTDTTQRLRTIEAPELSLEDTARSMRLQPRAGDAMVGGGFNPYDRGAQGLGYKPPVVSIQSKVAAARKPVKDLQRLDGWLSMKRRLTADD